VSVHGHRQGRALGGEKKGACRGPKKRKNEDLKRERKKKVEKKRKKNQTGRERKQSYREKKQLRRLC